MVLEKKHQLGTPPLRLVLVLSLLRRQDSRIAVSRGPGLLALEFNHRIHGLNLNDLDIRKTLHVWIHADLQPVVEIRGSGWGGSPNWQSQTGRVWVWTAHPPDHPSDHPR